MAISLAAASPAATAGDRQTVLLPPRGWAVELLDGWLAEQHEFLQEVFGEVGSVEYLSVHA